ncbi:ribokinase [Burkholderia sp. FERM BP-3421]|uniref:ribokinase n=1 Tax=Burkholderia sp. FERM BP-3421 TaxID=1494466 RepID=UPI00235F44AE|nr:ribokinase [Burkholderia sp. FERM BP-3421]WDD92284.1 ribokinase [Burkholderia sp. FERM BP-3421]
MGKIAVIGSNMVDLVTYVDRMPVRGETLEAPGFEIGCGGKGANQAVAAAKLGAEVVMVTKVGDDLFADNTLRNFAQAGIDTEHVRRVPGVPSGVAPIFVEPDSSNSILIVKGANRHLLPADIDAAAERIASCALIVLQLEIALDTVYYALEFGAARGIPVLLNPAPAVPGLDLARIAQAEFFVPNETELAIVTGMPVDSPAAIERAAASLVERGLRNVIVTLGARGSLWMSARGAHHAPGVPVDARDTTGAGDAYIGCFAHRYVAAGDVADAMRHASAYAAHSVTGRGTQKAYADAATFARFLRGIVF